VGEKEAKLQTLARLVTGEAKTTDGCYRQNNPCCFGCNSPQLESWNTTAAEKIMYASHSGGVERLQRVAAIKRNHTKRRK